MRIRQGRKKQTSLQLPATSLHLMQVSKFVEEYLHAQQKYLINLAAHAVHSHLPASQQQPDRSFDIDLQVPYIESQHYDSNATFTDSHLKHHPLLEDENFTDREAFNSVSSEADRNRDRKMLNFQEEEEELVLEDFQFIKNNKKSKDSPINETSQYCSKPLSSATLQTQKPSRACEETQEQLQLQHLQETAYFLQQRERVDRKLMYSSENYQGNNQNVQMVNKQARGEKAVTSKKAILLNKIEKEKSRKEIAEAISKERHHIKKFLK